MVALVLCVIFALSPPADTSWKYERLRKRMVANQIEGRGVANSAVLEAMRSVPRHRFAPDHDPRLDYADRPLPIGHQQTISQPFIVARMTELVRPASADRALEVGTGSGYQAAVLAEIVDSVFTIEIIPELATTARQRLQQLGYDNVVVKTGDGYKGWPRRAPFDLILVTAAPETVPPPLLDQLADGGRMVVPVGPSGRVQWLTLITKRNGKISKQKVSPVRFVPFLRNGDEVN